ncbi:MAG: hypothetical protein V2A74_06525, partial [bacterium]
LLKKGREFELPPGSFDSLQGYVRKIGFEGDDESDSALFLRAYATYVLALDGDLEALEQISRFDHYTLPTTARLLLAAALAQNTRDDDRVKLYLARPSKPGVVAEADATLSSDVRTTAIELLALRQMNAPAQQQAEKARQLARFLEERHHGTTQEAAFIITALGEYLGDLANQLDDAEAAVIGPEGREVIRGNELYRATAKGPGTRFAVTNTGRKDLYLSVTHHGIPAVASTGPISKGLTVSRTIVASDDRPCTSSLFRQTESYVVAVRLDCANPVKNLILADLLPAGFEIENPRLDDEALPGGKLKAAVTPSHLELRDDRIVAAFEALEKGDHYFYYVVRAVTPGTFQHPPVEAECMYDASIRAASAISAIEVR